ncbi:MAG: hypothetical protein AAGH92_04710 [Planctomycetota bacterium]
MPETLTSKPFIVLVVLAVIAAGLYLYRGCAGGPPLQVQVTGGVGDLMFLFDGRVGVEELIVTADPDGEADGPRVVWHLVPRDEDDFTPPLNMAVTYGRRGGLRLRPAPDTPRMAEPLEPGVTYELFADTTAGDARKRFTIPDA